MGHEAFDTSWRPVLIRHRDFLTLEGSHTKTQITTPRQSEGIRDDIQRHLTSITPLWDHLQPEKTTVVLRFINHKAVL